MQWVISWAQYFVALRSILDATPPSSWAAPCPNTAERSAPCSMSFEILSAKARLLIRGTSVSYGRNQTAAAVHWPQWDKKRFQENVQAFMTEYLGTAFSTSHFPH